MASLRHKVDAEYENIQNVLKQIPPADDLKDLSVLELAGVSTFLHNFYNGVENILKQVLKERDVALPVGGFWHRDLLELSQSEGIIPESVLEQLLPYLAFRHFFSHGYSIDLDPEKLESLVSDVDSVSSCFKEAINKSVEAH